MTEPTGIDIKVQLDLTLDTIIGDHNYRTVNEDGDYTSEPYTLIAAIIDRCAQLITGQIDKTELIDRLRRRIMDVRDEMIRERITPIIDEAFELPITMTNQYGEPTKGTKTLRELIIAEVQSHMKLSVPATRTSPTPFDKVISAITAQAITAELQGVLEVAKAEVRERFKALATDAVVEALVDRIKDPYDDS